MLSGDNGLLKKAGDARENTEIASTKEQILLEILGSYDKSVSLNLETLKTNLENIGAYVTGDNFPLEVSLNNHSYIISDNGELEEFIPIEPLTEEQLANIIGGFANYNVPYTDAYYPTYSFDNTNGWRIINIEESNGKYDIDIISTGIIAKFSPSISYDTDALWPGTIEQVKEYYDDVGSERFKNHDLYGTSAFKAFYEAYGLKFNFTKIPFNQGNYDSNNKNIAYYQSLNNKEGNLHTEKAVTEAFSDPNIASKITNIREVEASDIKEDLGKALESSPGSIGTTEELNDKARGLFKLTDLKNINGMSMYVYGSDAQYWLATPCSKNYWENQLWEVSYRGSFGNSHPSGLRPVISLSGVQVTYNQNTNLWELK